MTATTIRVAEVRPWASAPLDNRRPSYPPKVALLAPLGRKTAAVPEVAGLAVEGQELETDGRVDL